MKIGIQETTINNLKHELSLSERTRTAASSEKQSLEEEINVTKGRVDEYEAKVKRYQFCLGHYFHFHA